MTDKKAVKTVRLPQPDADRVAEYQDENNLSEADAYRELIRAGLRAKGHREKNQTAFGLGLTFGELLILLLLIVNLATQLVL